MVWRAGFLGRTTHDVACVMLSESIIALHICDCLWENQSYRPFKSIRNVGFKYSVCCSWPMVVATHTKFSHISQQFLTEYSGPSIIQSLINRTFGYPNCSDDCSIRVFYIGVRSIRVIEQVSVYK